jgi:uncharacterized membrane protein
MDRSLREKRADEHPSDGILTPAIASIRRRIISGLIAALPIVLTFWIIYWLYSTLQRLVLDPAARLINRILGVTGTDLPPLWENFVAPMFAILVVLVFLYVLGFLVSSSLYRVVDRVLNHFPIVTSIYGALRNRVRTLQNPLGQDRLRRTVLVEFPQPGLRSLAFVTNTLTDETTGKTILCVCVLTGVMPPSGFTLFVPEESVTDLDWTVNQTIQAILSGGITTPEKIPYFRISSSRS